ncbi:DNA-binding protein [Undibacterium sp. TJN19]|uniref:DNA-binding protein n=1 Tax=Undibacterium sp. TJN19 TaxID=3413055 RepID=UPI003BF15044
MSERQSLSWAACDALAAEGKKPSIGLVREWTIATTGSKKGSDGDVQRDISLWFTDLLKLKRAQAVAQLPAPIAALTRDLWHLAVESASDLLSTEREAMKLEKEEVTKLMDLVRVEKLAASELAAQLKSSLSIANETISGRDETIKRLEASLIQIQAALLAKEERIEGLSAELARRAEEQAAGQAERDGLRKHALLQIDQARAESRHWKSEFERVDHENKSTVETYRQKASSLSSELAAALGRLGALEDSLVIARQRIHSLETELSSSNAATSPANKRLSGGKFVRSVIPRRTLR